MQDLGLADSSIIGTTDNPTWATPFVGSVDNHGYFLATNPGQPHRQLWLVGLDIHTGEPLFSPVTIDSGSNTPKCFLNGPESVLCVADEVRGDEVQSKAWVIDTRTGKVLFNGPTQLHTTPGSGVRVDQVGIYAVAEMLGQGIFGIGPQAETTWLVPGTTKVSTSPRTADADHAPLAIAEDSADGTDQVVVFSLIDGKVITPDIDDGLVPQAAVVYPGGFAIKAVAENSMSVSDAVMFFDETGNRLHETHISGPLSVLSSTPPVVESSPSYSVFGANGTELIQLPDGLGSDALLIGHRLYVPESTWEGSSKVRRWRQFDLTTGKGGVACRPNMSQYIGNDGSVGVFETSANEVTGASTFAMDLASCEKLWATPVNAESFHRLWRINDTLVELSDDAKELHSLVSHRE
ncbi:hypothetical protein [Mycolicibacterium wolinskyi]|uniref:hypothetical protein n=1 Tax=Mycolicibacterium wolinskyi TaxID=59750 RepID=UPI0039179B4B